jgi:hypothetical protein
MPGILIRFGNHTDMHSFRDLLNKNSLKIHKDPALTMPPAGQPISHDFTGTLWYKKLELKVQEINALTMFGVGQMVIVSMSGRVMRDHMLDSLYQLLEHHGYRRSLVDGEFAPDTGVYRIRNRKPNSFGNIYGNIFFVKFRKGREAEADRFVREWHGREYNDASIRAEVLKYTNL